MSHWFQTCGAYKVAIALICHATAELSYYGDRMDPWDTRHVKTLDQGDGMIVQVEVQYGGATAVQFNPETQEVAHTEITREDVLAMGFPRDALDWPIEEDIWTQRKLWDGRRQTHPIDPECPRRGDGHLAKATLEVLEAIGKNTLLHKMINIGGMYGAGMPDLMDDPIVETLRAHDRMKLLCIDCGDFSNIERLQGYQNRIEVSPLESGMDIGNDFRNWRKIDVLRIESMPSGTSCLVLRSVLKVVSPTVVVLIVHGQIPPPIRFSTIRDSGNADVTGALYSCSVAAVSAILEVHGLSLLRLSGPYALFVRRDAWKSSALPLDSTECFRHIEAWGADIFPIEFVRSWLFEADVMQSVAHVHSNISAAFSSFGLPGEPFMLSV